jgi:2-dehydro-3-deoxygluconokinase
VRPVVTIGETMGLFRAVSAGSLADVTEFELGIGGAESNVAIGLARLGVPSRWIGRVGNDPIGARIVRDLLAEGVDAVATVDESAATAIMVKEQTTSDARQVIYYRAGSAGSRLSIEDLEPADLPGAALLHVSGITPALSQSAHAAVFGAIRVAKSAGVAVSFDVNHRDRLWMGRDPAPVYRQLAALADVVFAGADEARILAPEADAPADLARAIAALGPSQVLIKLGEHGCVAVIEGVDYAQDALPVAVVDTVGAGDAFVAGYLAELVAGLPPAARLRTAAAAGAFACLHVGDWEGLPTREELARIP